MALIYRNGVEYTAVLDVNALPTTDINCETVYRVKDADNVTHLYVRNADNNAWFEIQENKNFVGAYPDRDGKSGIVPAPVADNSDDVLTGDGKWHNAFIGDITDQYDLDSSEYLTKYVAKALSKRTKSTGYSRRPWVSEIVSFPAKVKIPPSTSYTPGVCELTIALNASQNSDWSTLVLKEKFIVTKNSSYGTVEEPVVYERTGTHNRPTYTYANIEDPTEYTWTDWTSSFIYATETTDGGYGHVPKPIAGSDTRVLDANKGWTDIKEDNDFVFDGATWEESGKAGVVPQPPIEGQDKVLTGGGEWRDPFIGATTADCYSLDDSISLYSFEFRDWVDRWIVPSIKSIEASPDSMPYAKRSEVICIPSQIFATTPEGLETNLYGTGTIEIAYDKNGKCISMHIRFVDNDYSMIEKQYQYECEGYIEDWGTDGGNTLVYSNWHFTPWRPVNSLSEFEGATTEDDGKAGIVPAPKVNEFDKVLEGDGKWHTAFVGDMVDKDDETVKLYNSTHLYKYLTPFTEKEGFYDSDAAEMVSFPCEALIEDRILGVCEMTMAWDANKNQMTIVEKFIVNDTLSDVDDNIYTRFAVGNAFDIETKPIDEYTSYEWTDWKKVHDPVFLGATDSTDGTSGTVPKPEAGDQNKFLKGDGTWADVSVDELPPGTHTGYSVYGSGYITSPLLVAVDVKRYLKNGESFDFKLPINGAYSGIPGRTWATGYLYVMVIRFSATSLYVYEKYTDMMESKLTYTRFGTISTTNVVDLDLNNYASADHGWRDWIKQYPDVFVGATSSADGSAGIVPKPVAGTSTRVLSANKVWTDIKTDTDFLFGKATSSADGSAGIVPKPVAGEQNKFIKGNGKWSDVSMLKVEKSSSTDFYTITDISYSDSALYPIKTKLEKSCTMKYSFPCRNVKIPSYSTAQNANVLFEIYASITSETTSWIYIKETVLAFSNATDFGEKAEWYRYGVSQDHNPVTSESDITWTGWLRNTDSFEGATSSANGRKGLVPAPEMGSQNAFLKGDGTWSSPPYLTTAQAGIVTTAPNDTTKFLRGDATWAGIESVGHNSSPAVSDAADYKNLDSVTDVNTAYAMLKTTWPTVNSQLYVFPAMTKTLPAYNGAWWHGTCEMEVHSDQRNNKMWIYQRFVISNPMYGKSSPVYYRNGVVDGKTIVSADSDIVWSHWEEENAIQKTFVSVNEIYDLDSVTSAYSAYYPIKTETGKEDTNYMMANMSYSLPCFTFSIVSGTAMWGHADINIYRDSEKSTVNNIYIRETFYREQASYHQTKMKYTRVGYVTGKTSISADADIVWSAWETYNINNTSRITFTPISSVVKSLSCDSLVQISPNTYNVHFTFAFADTVTPAVNTEYHIASNVYIDGVRTNINSGATVYCASGMCIGTGVIGNTGHIYICLSRADARTNVGISAIVTVI